MTQGNALTTAKRNTIRQTIRILPTSRLVLLIANTSLTEKFLRDHVPSQNLHDLAWAVQSLSDELDRRVPAGALTAPRAASPVQDAPEATPRGASPAQDAADVASRVASPAQDVPTKPIVAAPVLGEDADPSDAQAKTISSSEMAEIVRTVRQG